jgi:hypothetical protein
MCHVCLGMKWMSVCGQPDKKLISLPKNCMVNSYFRRSGDWKSSTTLLTEYADASPPSRVEAALQNTVSCYTNNYFLIKLEKCEVHLPIRVSHQSISDDNFW